MKIGVFGGSFNPPHKMHLDIGVQLINKHYVDNVVYVPTGGKYKYKNNYRKLGYMVTWLHSYMFVYCLSEGEYSRDTAQPCPFLRFGLCGLWWSVWVADRRGRRSLR